MSQHPNHQILMEAVETERQKLASLGINIADQNLQKPWGGYFVIDESQAELFCQHYFTTTPFSALGSGRLSPKLLFVLPGEELSWQEHEWRSEIWQVVSGFGHITLSLSDHKNQPALYSHGSFVQIAPRVRHMANCPTSATRTLVIAEFWIHMDPNNPSNEDDIRRVSDKYHR